MIVDFHYHLAASKEALRELIDDMDRSGVERTCLMGGPEDAFWEFKNCSFAGNEAVLAAVRQHPDRLVGNVYIDPRAPDAAEVLNRYIGEGFRCVKMFPPVGFYPDDERYFPLYEAIEYAGVPVLFHAGQTNIKVVSGPSIRRATSTKYANPIYLDSVSRLFPKMSIVLAHMGYPYYIEAWSMAHANPNVYLDIAGSGPWTEGISVVYNALGGSAFIPVDFSRVVWGTDNCLPQREHLARSDVYMRQMGADTGQRKLIFGDTAKMLLNIQ